MRNYWGNRQNMKFRLNTHWKKGQQICDITSFTRNFIRSNSANAITDQGNNVSLQSRDARPHLHGEGAGADMTGKTFRPQILIIPYKSACLPV
jgi:hypothetical protein